MSKYWLMLGGVRDAMVSYRQLETKVNEEVFLKVFCLLSPPPEYKMFS